MRQHQALARTLCVTAVSLIIGGLSPAFADEPASPTPDREIEQLIQAKLELLSTIEESRPAPFSGQDAESASAAQEVVLNPGSSFQKNVDCEAGESVNRTLTSAPFTRRVVLHIYGTCDESVVVDRPGVTLSGSRSGTAVIDPPEDEEGIPIGPAVYAVGALELTLEDLTLRGGTHGLEAYASRRVRLTRVNAVENRASETNPWSQGVYLNRSDAQITDSNLSSNVSPLWANNHSTARVSDTLMENNLDGPFGWDSTLRLVRCTMRGNGWGPQAWMNSYMTIVRSTVEAPTIGMTAVGFGSQVGIGRTELYGPIFASDDAFIQIEGGSIDGSIYVGNSSFARINADAIRGPITVDLFSDAWIRSAEEIEGSVNCSRMSQAICDPDPTGGMHGCE